MKLFLILILIAPLTVFAQINQTDPSGLRQGLWQKTYPNGQIIYEGMFKDGKPVGKWTRYHEGGQVKAIIRYSEKSDSAITQHFDRRGNKIAEGVYIAEKREGMWSFFPNGIKILEEEYINGEKHGISRKFYTSGEVLEEVEWQNGKQEGNYRVFFKNGEPYIQCKFSNGKRNGLCLVHFKNGRVETEGHYIDNLRHGEWKFYNDKGNYMYSLDYDHGRLLNPEIRDSIDNLHIQQLEKNRYSIPDPEEFINDPEKYMIKMQKIR